MRSRAAAFVAVTAACTASAGAYVTWAALNAGSATTGAEAAGSRVDEALAGRELVVRSIDPRDPRLNGRVMRVRLGRDGARLSPAPGSPACVRVHFSGGRGICLQLAPSGVDYRARVLDGQLRTTASLALEGLPSRARVAPDGRLGAITTFVSGDSYAAPGTFSTRTKLVDLERGRVLADLEEFEVFRNGRRIRSPDFNFWGVTFASDGRTFYATLATSGTTYLVRGDALDRSAGVLRENVECPSLSPDGTRVAYKRNVAGDPAVWRFHVLDLRSGRDVALAEERSIDDQIEWLDAGHLVYGDGRRVWVVDADGGGRPRPLLTRADSPAVLR